MPKMIRSQLFEIKSHADASAEWWRKRGYKVIVRREKGGRLRPSGWRLYHSTSKIK